MKENLKERISKMSPTVKGFLLIIIILIVGILFRWNYIVEEISKGFNYFSK